MYDTKKGCCLDRCRIVRLLYIGIYGAVLGLSLGLLLGAQPIPNLAEVRISRGSTAQEIARFAVEIADQPREWQRGLMERSFLAQNAGMLFVFVDQAPRAFWMMNTLIHLDIIFAGGGLVLPFACRGIRCSRVRGRCEGTLGGVEAGGG